MFAAVNAANARRTDERPTARLLSAVAAFACAGALVALVFAAVDDNPASLWLLAGLLGIPFAIEVAFRAFGRPLSIS